MADLKAFHRALADRPLQPSDPRYSELYLRGLHLGSTKHDLIGELAKKILWDEGGGAYLFTGQRGTGKSTELHRLRKMLEDEGCEAFYVDMSQFLNLTARVDAGDFLFSLFGGFSEAIKRRFGNHPGERGYLERAWHYLQSEVKIEEAGLTIPAGPAELSLKAALQSDPDFKKTLQDKTRGHLAGIKQQAAEFAQEAVKFIADKTGKPDVKVVVLVDSVEQLRGVGTNAEPVFASVQELFSGQTDSLKFAGLSIVYTIPPYLLAISKALSAYYDGGKVYALSSVHLFESRSREISAEGLNQMIEIVRLRFPEWDQVFTRDQLRELAESSGGDIRDYFRLIRLCLGRTAEPLTGAASPRVSALAVEGSKADLLRDMLPIALEDLRWLKRIAASHDTELQTNKDLPTLARFFEGKMVLNYRNGDDWYDVHPLLRKHVSECPD